MKTLRDICDDHALLEIGRKAVEDVLIELRDDRIALAGRHNGLVVYERDGKESFVIRLGPEDCLRIGLAAIERALSE